MAEGLVSAHGPVTHPPCLLLVPPLAPHLCPHRVAPSDSTSLEEAGQSEGLMREGQTEEGPMKHGRVATAQRQAVATLVGPESSDSVS